MVNVETGRIKKGQLIALIVLLSVALQVILRAVAPHTGFDLLLFCLAVIAVIIVAARRQPTQAIKKPKSTRSFKDLE